MTFSSVFCAVVWVALGPLVFGCSAKRQPTLQSPTVRRMLFRLVHRLFQTQIL